MLYTQQNDLGFRLRRGLGKVCKAAADGCAYGGPFQDSLLTQPCLTNLALGSISKNFPLLAAAAAAARRLLPQEAQAQRRAYLSNICVAAGARRQGIAGALMAEAERVAAGLGERAANHLATSASVHRASSLC